MTEEAVARIRRMEALFDALLAGSAPEGAVEVLTDYCKGGLWLHDYELDEAGLLPPELKRGVLSQDGVYDLLERMKEETI